MTFSDNKLIVKVGFIKSIFKQDISA